MKKIFKLQYFSGNDSLNDYAMTQYIKSIMKQRTASNGQANMTILIEEVEE